jgi:excisionase family DNA binding protein
MTEPAPELYETCSCHVCATLRSLLASDADPQVGRSPMETVPPLLLTTDQAAVMLGVTRDVVSQLIGQGELRSVEVLTYGRRRIPRAEIEGYVARLLSGQLRGARRSGGARQPAGGAGIPTRGPSGRRRPGSAPPADRRRGHSRRTC